MDLINGILNLAAPPFTLFALLHLLPQWNHFKYWLGILRSIFSDDVSGKVVLITDASSAIGQYLAYEYASRGACLALAAMTEENRLREVVDRCLKIGSPEVVTQYVDVANVNDCRHFIDQVVNHFGRLDHLVNNAGISQVSALEEIDDITNMQPLMDINFWGSVYITRFAAPHLRRTKGRIIVVSSPSACLPEPGMSLYNASKAAVVQFFETLRVELGSDIKITIATCGLAESELTQGQFLTADGEMVVDPNVRDVQLGRAEECARAIVKSACRGERDVTEPTWIRMVYIWKVFWPEMVEWTQRLILMASIVNSQEGLTGQEYLISQREILNEVWLDHRFRIGIGISKKTYISPDEESGCTNFRCIKQKRCAFLQLHLAKTLSDMVVDAPYLHGVPQISCCTVAFILIPPL